MNTIAQFTQQVDETIGKTAYEALIWAASRATGLHDRAQIIDDVRVPYFYRAGEQSSPLLFIHGFGGDKEGWLGMSAFLSRHRGLILPDLPGFGAAGPADARQATPRAQARVLLTLLDRLGVRRVHAIGNSMGGGIAQRLAHDAPERIASMTLIGSMGPIVEPSEFGQALAAGTNPLITADPVDYDRLIRLVAERVPPVPRVIRRYLGATQASRSEGLASIFPAVASPPAGEGLPDLEAIETPTFILHGVHDRVIHPSTARALHGGLPNARLEMLEGLGHIPHLEAPRTMARALEAFLQSLPEG